MLLSWSVWASLMACAEKEVPVAPVVAAPIPEVEDGERRGRKGGGRGRQAGDRRGGGAGRLVPAGELPRLADPCGTWDKPGLYEHKFPFGPNTTPTLVYIPNRPGPHRMAVLLHGGHGTPEDILEDTNVIKMADAEGIVVVAPTGAGGADRPTNWNSRDTPGMERDDVKYLDALVRDLKERTCSKQVLAVGFSNGSMMAMRWLCQGDTPDAGVTAAGRMGVAVATCKGPRPHRNYVGTDDDHYTTDHPTTPESLDMWAQINRCNGPAQEQRSGRVTTRSWSGCRAPTQEFVIAGFPHAWPRPGGKGDAPMDAMVETWPWFLSVVP